MEHKSQSTNNSGCFSGFLRLILCRNDGPTRPSDYTPKLKPNADAVFHSFPNIKDQTKLDDEIKVVEESHKPGIVARLMGLESLPDSKVSPKLTVKSPDSVFRSRSVNFMDYLLEVDLNADHCHRLRHRRVKTSVSFREVPGLHQQQQDMLVVFLENTAPTEQTETVSKPKKTKDRSIRKERRVVNVKDDEPRRVHSRNNRCSSRSDGEFVKQGENKIKKKQVKVMEEKEIMSELKFTVKKMKMKEKTKIKGVHNKQASETSTSVSVLNLKHRNFKAQKDSFRAKKKPGVISSTKKKNGLVEMEGSNRAPSTVHHQLEIEYCLKMLGKVCSLLEQDIKTSSNRMTVKEDFEEICLKIERAIMDHMIQEAVDELNIC